MIGGTDWRTLGAKKEILVIKAYDNTRNADFVPQQDVAPSHTAKIIQEWMKLNMTFWANWILASTFTRSGSCTS